jgi:hypothetical protein
MLQWKQCNNIYGKPPEGLTKWVPIQLDGNTLADGDLVYGSCEEDLYYEIWETNNTSNHSTQAWLLMWQRSEANNNLRQ